MTADALLAIIAGRDTTGLYEVRCRSPRTGKIEARRWFPIGSEDQARRYMLDCSRRRGLDVYVGATPRTRRAGGKDAIDHAWCLWADVDAPAALERLQAFYPTPSLIVRSGSGRNVHAYWSLSEPLPPAWTERANRRLAHHLGADMKTTDVARILRPPGTLNWKHDPPALVTADSFEDSSYSVADVVKNLDDPPSKSPVPKPRIEWTSLDGDPDPLENIPADVYYSRLTGRPVTGVYVQCPIHREGKERIPSLRLYGYDGWYCFGCGEGGNVYSFAARLWGYSLPVQGATFVELRNRLLSALR